MSQKFMGIEIISMYISSIFTFSQKAFLGIQRNDSNFSHFCTTSLQKLFIKHLYYLVEEIGKNNKKQHNSRIRPNTPQSSFPSDKCLLNLKSQELKLDYEGKYQLTDHLLPIKFLEMDSSN